MKHILTDAETFATYAEIDCAYFLLNKIKEKEDFNIGNIDEIIDLAKGIIENKKKLDADFSYDEKYLKEFLRIKEELRENMEQND